MKKYILVLTLLIAGFTSCKKEEKFDATAQATKDEASIKGYLAANPSIQATKDASGIYYQVITAGTGTTNPTVASTVNVNYTGQVLNGATFATSANLTNPLAGLIKGWQAGIPKIKSGGRILLIIPSGLAYGNNSPGGPIPANAVLIFTIDLISFSG